MLRFFVWFLQKNINVSYKIFNFFWKLLIWGDSIIEGFWLSVLSEKQLNKFIVNFYKKNKQYTQDEQTKKGLYPWEKNIADNIPNKNSTIAVLGAGGGRECLALGNMGFKLSAYESDINMVEYAKRFFKNEGLNIPFSHIAINTVPKFKCDVFWFGWGMYTHVIKRENRVRILDEAKNIIPKDGYIIISYWNEAREAIRINTVEKTVRVINKRLVEKGEGFRNGFWTKRFTPEQIREEAALAGLKVVHISEVEYGHAILAPE